MLCCLLQLRYFDQGRNDFFFAAFKQYVVASAEEAQKVSSCQHGLQQPRLTYRYTDLAQPTTDGIQAQHLLCGLPRPTSIIRCVRFCLQGLTRAFTIAEVWVFVFLQCWWQEAGWVALCHQPGRSLPHACKRSRCTWRQREQVWHTQVRVVGSKAPPRNLLASFG